MEKEIGYNNFTPEEFAKQHFSQTLESMSSKRFLMLPTIKTSLPKVDTDNNTIIYTDDGVPLDQNYEDDQLLDSGTLFQILLEITLYGLNIISPEYSLFKINSEDDLSILNKYLNKMFINLNSSKEEFENINYFRERDNWYCHISNPLPEFLINENNIDLMWQVDKYQMFQNNLFLENDETQLEEYKAVVRNKNTLYYFWFNVIE